MSFNNEARRVRDPALPYAHRVRALHSCVTLYPPMGYRVTLRYLEVVAGRYKRDEAALLRAIELLDASRRLRTAAQEEYAVRRRVEKRAGRRVPRWDDPDPAALPVWFGDVRGAALFALRHRTRLRWGIARSTVEELQASDAPGARDLAALVTACLETGGELSAEQRQSLASLMRNFYRGTSLEAYHRSPEAYRAAWDMTRTARLVAAAADASG